MTYPLPMELYDFFQNITAFTGRPSEGDRISAFVVWTMGQYSWGDRNVTAVTFDKVNGSTRTAFATQLFQHLTDVSKSATHRYASPSMFDVYVLENGKLHTYLEETNGISDGDKSKYIQFVEAKGGKCIEMMSLGLPEETDTSVLPDTSTPPTNKDTAHFLKHWLDTTAKGAIKQRFCVEKEIGENRVTVFDNKERDAEVEEQEEDTKPWSF